MRVLIATQAERTHFLGMVPLAWALRAAGHEVRVASQPALGPVVSATGLPFVPVGRDHLLRRVMRQYHAMTGGEEDDFDMAEDRDEVLTWDYLLEGYRLMVPWWWRMVNDPMEQDLVAFCREWRPDLVVWEPITFSAAIAARACGAAHVRYLWGADIFARTRARFLERMAEQPEADREDPLAAWLGARAARYGVEFSEELVHGQATVEQVPASLRVDTPPHLDYLPVRYVPYNGRAVVPHWLRTPPERPRIGLSLGTSATEWYGEHQLSPQEALKGLADLDVEVVATLPAHEQAKLGAVPDNTRLVDYVPLHALAPTCAAMITHGGPGTVLTALTSGIPQLLAPNANMFDTVLLSGLVRDRGAALLLPPDRVTPDAVADGVRALLHDPSLTRAARTLRHDIAAMPTPADLAHTLTALTTRP
ncbi:activator-dependent family glycosyltransferase [Nocardiopsis tropica]|uniref:Activator-dependent family glycosyltransferase n=1 Tax=Nocardiopsis tropica TaxID=109330 RepID=A0ABU7KU45_9ACTN|nr:activator-dependent family glycosyltransferase [Nocardiopsis umidischolae]MEE2052811.1 activator-dependent family glycosyltransferase [Nocardiopsis umidischolae]